MEILLKSKFDAEEVKKFQAAITQRQSEIEMLRSAIRHYQKLCPHPNMHTYREIDGGRGGRCYVCGYSY